MDDTGQRRHKTGAEEMVGFMNLLGINRLFVRQVHEMVELIGFETRNKYAITDEQGNALGFAAEQQKSLLGFFLRQFLGHWRSFEIHYFTPDRQPYLIGYHPFRWYFTRFEVRDAKGQFLGALQRRFAIFSKSFDVKNANGQTIMEVSSPFWRIWTFPFTKQGREVASIQKKWSGLLAEGFTDKDNFLVEFKDPGLTHENRQLLMAAAVFVDLLYFKRKAR